jgi:hypothetical protein
MSESDRTSVAERGLSDRPAVATDGPERRRLFRRGPWENAATVIIAAGVFMLMQPFWLPLYTYSFITILTGTVMFIVVSHFRD